MNWPHIHLVLTHIPVIGVPIIAILGAMGKLRDSREIEWVTLELFAGLAVLAVGVYLTGSPASHQLRQLPGVSREFIHHHSEAADFAFAGMEGLGILCLGGIVKFRQPEGLPRPFMNAVLVFALAVIGLLLWTAGLGGRIRHPEVVRLAAALRITPQT